MVGVEISGFVSPGFEAVRECFITNFNRDDHYREVGAGFCVYLSGECVVDLCGGFANEARTRPWQEDTTANIWSATKGLTAIAVAVLVDRGLIDYGERVGTYWPEFACKGKEHTTVSQVLSHQAGLPGFVEPITLEEFYDWPTVVSRLESQEPMWEPGTKNSYHAMTFGFLAGEIIRRASGKGIGAFLQEAVAEPLGADVYIGLPESEEPRVAEMVPSPLELELDMSEMPPEALASVTNPTMEPGLPNNRLWRAAEIPAGNGQATARGLSKVYGAIANKGELDGCRLLSESAIAAMNTVQTDRVDISIGVAPYWRNGHSGNINHMYGPGENAFGHSGWGGAVGCADPDREIGIGYVVNQMGNEALGDERSVALIHTLYDCLG